MGQGPAWGVVATVDEPAQLVAAFVAHHLDQGAAEVHVFLDRPDAEAEALLADLPGVFVTACDAAYWQRSARGQRPPRHTARQNHNATAVYRRTGVSWLLHCDADEFLFCEAPLEEELASQPARIGYLRIRNVERAWPPEGPGAEIFDGPFRLPIPEFQRLGPRIYGPGADYLNQGVSGHVAGKGIVRTGRNYLMGIHYPRFDTAAEEKTVPRRPSQTAVLLHFDGLTPLHWALKLLKRVGEPRYAKPRNHGAHRTAQFIEMARICREPGAAAALCRAVQGLDAAQMRALCRLDAVAEIRPDIAGAVARHLPGRGLDLSAAAFDRALIAREARLIEETGLDLATVAAPGA